MNSTSSSTTRNRDRPPVTRNRFGTIDSQQNYDDRGSSKATSGSERITSKPSSRIGSVPQHGLPSPPNTISSADTGSGSVGDCAVKPSSYSSYHQSFSRRNGTATRNNQSSSIQTIQSNTRLSTPSSNNSDPADPSNLRPANLFHGTVPFDFTTNQLNFIDSCPSLHFCNSGSSSRGRLRQLRSVSSLASFKQESNPPRTRPSTIHRASITSTHSSVRRSMDHSSVEGKSLSSTRSHFDPTHTSTLPRNSKNTQIRRISSVWKSQGFAPKDAPRHSLEISPTKTIVSPALVTDVPIPKRTSTNDLSNSTLHKASSSNLSITSLNKISVRPSRTGSSGSLELIGSKVLVRERRSQSTLSKIDEPPSSQRSKKLVSMKEKNKRILANINATLSPPTSPAKDDQHPPLSEPPLPPPPPSSGSSSPSSSSSSDLEDRSASFQSVLSVSEPLPGPLEDLESPVPTTSSSRNSLTIPRQSGLIPFAQGYSPSPRKVSNPSQSTALADEGGIDEDVRLGSVRGKGPGSRLPLSCFEMGDDDDGMTGKAGENLPEDGEQDDLDHTLTQEVLKDNERPYRGDTNNKGHMIQSQIAQSKRDPHTSKLVSNLRADTGISTAQTISNHRLHSPSFDDFTSADLPQHQHLHGDEQPRDSRPWSNHSRQPSESRSMQTASSETIGKGLGGSRDSLSSPAHSDSHRHPEYEDQGDADDTDHRLDWIDNDVHRVPGRLETEEDMRTPVKTRTGPLRHSSSGNDFAAEDHPHQASRSIRVPLSSISSRRGPVPRTGLLNHQRVSSHDPPSGYHVIHRSEDLSVRQTSPSLSASSSPLQSRTSDTRPSRASSLLPSSRPPSHVDHIDPELTAQSGANPSHTYSRASSISHSRRHNQQTEEWHDPKPRSSIFPSSRIEQQPSTAMIASKTISARPNSQSSPPQSYSRRPRPGLPDHFIQPPRSNGASQSSDGRSSSRISAVMSSHSGKQIFDPTSSPDRRHSMEPALDRIDRHGKPLDLRQSPRRHNTHNLASPQQSPKRYMVNDSRRSMLSSSRNSSIDQSGPCSSSIVNGSMSVRELRRGVESSLSFYEASPSQNIIHRSGKPLFRTKHSSLTDEFGMGNLERSQSVMGGVYDPRNLTNGQLRHRNWNSNNPLFSGHREARARYEDDDDGLSATTYNYPQSNTYTAGSNGSSGRRSKYQESPSRDAVLRSESMLNATRRSNVTSTPTKHRPSLERDRTVRGSGGGGGGGGGRSTGSLQLTHVIRGSQDSTRHGSIPDHQSSSSGGSSRRQHGQSRMAQASLLGSGRGATRTPNLNNSINHRVTSNTRAPTRAESSRAGALGTGILSPTPEIEHHKLLIEALESLDQSQLRNFSSNSGDDSHSLLVQLVSSVVKHSCRINASLKELVESGVNSQVELELLDDELEDERGDSEQRYRYDERNAGPASSRKSSSTIRKCEILQAERSQIERVHGQLVRSSNDQIRDLTETLICLNKLQRKTERESNAMRRLDNTSNIGSEDQRLSSGLATSSHSRSISRASGYYSQSASPTKLRQFSGITPLSRIDSVDDDSPLARVSKKISVNNTPTSPVGATSRDRQFLVDLPARASTVAFAQNRHHSLGVGRTHSIGRAQKDRLAARSRLSGIEPRASRGDEPIDEFASYRTSFDSQHSQQSQHQSRSSISDRNTRAEGRTESARQSMEGNQTTHSILNRPQRSSTNQSTSTTIRGTQSMMMFPRTPKRLTTSLVTELNAHSNFSPTNSRAIQTRQYSDEEEEEEEDYHNNEDERTRRLGTSINRSQSSMSHILDRAQTMLSRAGHRDDSDLALGSSRGRYLSDASTSSNLRNVISQEQIRSTGERARRKENDDDQWNNLQHERTRKLTSQSTMDLNQFESYQNGTEFNDDDGQTPMKKRTSRNAHSQSIDSKYRFGRNERGESESVMLNEEEEEAAAGMKKVRSRKMSAATAALERLSHLGGKSWGGRISSAMSSSGSGSAKMNEDLRKKKGDRDGIDEGVGAHHQEEFGGGLVRSSTMIEGGRKRGQSIQQLLKMKRSSIVRS